MESITALFSYSFMLRAIIVGLLVSLSAALLGVNLVLRRYSMIGDGLSHIGFGALSIAAVCGIAPLKVAIPVVTVSAFLLLRLKSSSKVKGDAAIALISTGALAVGVLAVSLSSGVNIDLNSYLFGSILSLSKEDTVLACILSGVVILLYIFFYNMIFDISFDGDFATASGTKTMIGNAVIAVLTSVTVVLGMRLMGTLLISALIVFPPMAAMRITGRFRNVVILSASFSVAGFIAGILLSFYLSLPTGATVVCVDMLIFAVCLIAGKIKKQS